jgi:acid phosphatase (class A)
MKLQLLPGYLPRSQLPNSLALLPAPPPTGSAAYAEDLAAATSSLALRGTPRWTLAAQDAELNFPAAASVFSCAVQAPITEAGTPVLYRMLRRSLTDAGLATYAAKDTYRRSRPFTVNAAPICTPGIQAALTKDGSYPSGHTAIGWAWALILTELVPERTDAILARGRAFGESRVVCNVHWLSDVQEGRFVGAATVARLHADPMFRADLALAERELAAARANHVPPAPDCAAEAAAMGDHFLQ